MNGLSLVKWVFSAKYHYFDQILSLLKGAFSPLCNFSSNYSWMHCYCFFKYLYAYTLLKKTTYLHFQHNISAVRIDWTNNALNIHIHLLFMCKYAHFQGNLIAHVFKFASRVRKLANLENKKKVQSINPVNVTERAWLAHTSMVLVTYTYFLITTKMFFCEWTVFFSLWQKKTNQYPLMPIMQDG